MFVWPLDHGVVEILVGDLSQPSPLDIASVETHFISWLPCKCIQLCYEGARLLSFQRRRDCYCIETIQIQIVNCLRTSICVPAYWDRHIPKLTCNGGKKQYQCTPVKPHSIYLPMSPWEVGRKFIPRVMSYRIIGKPDTFWQVIHITSCMFLQFGTDTRTWFRCFETVIPAEWYRRNTLEELPSSLMTGTHPFSTPTSIFTHLLCWFTARTPMVDITFQPSRSGELDAM